MSATPGWDPSPTGEGRATWEVRADVPTGVLLGGIPGGVVQAAQRTRFVIDPAAGTVTFVNTIPRWGNLVARLPDRREPSNLTELHAVHVVALSGLAPSVRLVMTDRTGRYLAASGPIAASVYPSVWPKGRLEHLERAGILVSSETCPNRRALNERYPGAARWWWLTSGPRYWLMLLGSVVLFWTVVVAAIILSGH